MRDAVADEREELNRIGIALSSTRDVGLLLEMILAKTREITCADAGSLYIVESTGSENGLSGHPEKRLRFRLIQNDSRQFPYVEHVLPISEDSMAGYAALHGEVIVLDDVYCIPEDRPYRFNPRYDQETRYRTRSVLTVPMKNARGEVLGIMQLLNRKRDRSVQLVSSTDLNQEVEPFPWRAVRLAESLASQAAVAYENGQLYENIQRLFDGFVKAAVTAIEQRDPTTSGHSSRVAVMTLGMAEAVNRVKTGPYSQVYFSPEQMKEMKYASLLHDFGKIAVREDVLIKAKKLYPSQLAIIEQRFEYLHQLLETERMEKKLEAALQSGENRSEKFGEIDREFDARKADLQQCFQSILDLNEVTILPEQNEQQLMDLSRRTYLDRKGIRRNILTPAELASLSVREGSLNDDERQEIESHVMHSFNFLIHIPWTPELRYIPWIVRAHHEKLNGKGYPHGLRGEEIPLQARMMIICDIFDALSSADRPYKKAVTPRQAFAILESAVRKGELDAELYRIFIEAKIADLVAPSSERRFEDEEKRSAAHAEMLDTH